jgi:hypothetical protein
MKVSVLVHAITCGSLLCLSTTLCSGQGISNGGLQYMQTIGIPGWGQTGSTQANYDLLGFNPATRIMYIADRLSKGITAINTRSNVFIGVMPMPNGSSPNGVQVIPDLQLLVVTDGQKNVWVWDLRLPGNPPQQYAIPNIGGGTDAMDYDPANQTIYFINGTAPYYMTGLSLAFRTITSQLQLPWSPELTAYNTTDGLIWQVITDGDNKNANAGVIAYDPVANKIVNQVLTPNCVPHGIKIDPVSNVALLGCGTNQGQLMVSLKDATILKTFSDVTGTDLMDYNPNTRRFYTGSAGNKSTTTGCATDTTSSQPIIGIFEAPLVNGVVQPRLAGVACMGRNGKVGVDPIENTVYVPTRQYPVDPTTPTTGSAGVQVYRDLTPPAQALLTSAIATLKPLPGSSAGPLTVNMTPDARVLRLSAYPTGVKGSTVLISLSTTVTNEVVPCAADTASGNAVCGADLIGDPLIGSMVTLSVDGVPVARGPVTGQ